jgi:POT family proton-dependent oligopeptide transporter
MLSAGITPYITDISSAHARLARRRMMSLISETPPQRTDLFGHPRGLTFLFTTEMWERFSYFSMRAVLVLYMVKYLFEPTRVESVFGYAAVKDVLEFLFGPLSTQALASNIYGAYIGLVYLTPLIGGLLADRVLGQRATVVVGAVMMSIGQFMLVFDSLFFLGLLTLILGNGAFKPNTLTQVGALYAPGDARRDRAFLIVRVGFNVGAFFAPLVSGALAESLGWRYGFAWI